MKIFIFLITSILFSISGCISIKVVNSSHIKLFPSDAKEWNLEQCRIVMELYTIDNSGGEMFSSGLDNQDVYIRALLLNESTIKAMSRAEVIEKRLEEEDYYEILERYLNSFTGLTYNKEKNQIIELDSSYSKGYTFKIYFENISNPFKPIFLEDGYSYFFLENMNGQFSRVIEVTGLFVEDYFQLDGYLDAILTFSPFATNGKRLFNVNNLDESYRLVFNGLQKEPITIQCDLKNK